MEILLKNIRIEFCLPLKNEREHVHKKINVVENYSALKFSPRNEI